uniref:C2H2-type domain-containing protein n=1 Tax=Plectus sambesii TaxID=2011161 RepID=A0A914X3X0_9BILA
MPCQECAGMRVELLSLKEFMAQWFNILIQKIETVEKQNSRLNQMSQMRETERESSTNSLQSSSSSSSADEKMNSSSNFHHSCSSEKSTRPPSSSSGQSSTGSRSTVAPTYPGFRFNAADLGFTRRNGSSSYAHSSPTEHNCVQKSDSLSDSGLTMNFVRNGSSSYAHSSPTEHNCVQKSDSLSDSGLTMNLPMNLDRNRENRITDNDGYSSDFTCGGVGSGAAIDSDVTMRGADRSEEGRSSVSPPSSTAPRAERSSKHEMPRASDFEAKSLCTLNRSTGRFVCRLCQSSFTQFSNLRRHIRVIHQGLTKHACRYCDKVFAWKGAWRRHEQFVHELRRGANHSANHTASMVAAE